MVHVSIKVRDDIKKRRGTVVGFQDCQLALCTLLDIFLRHQLSEHAQREVTSRWR